MDIRRIKPGDEALWSGAVAFLIPEEDRAGQLISTDNLNDALADSRCYLYLAFSGIKPIGILSAYRFPDVKGGGSLAYLYDIEVSEEHRRIGVGAALVTELISRCREDGVRLIWAGTDFSNIPARRTFEATGAELGCETYAEYEWHLEG